jgi:hypothetical protein
LLQIPREQLLDHHGLNRVDADTGGVAGALGIDLVAVVTAGPGQEQTGAQLGQLAAPHPLGNEGAFVFGDCPANLQQQLVVGVFAHRTLHKDDLHPIAFQFLNQEHLVQIFAR